MTCGLAVCDLKLVWFPWFGCHAAFSSSVRLPDVASGRDTPSTLYFLFEIILRQQYCSVVPLLVWNEGHVTVASFLRKAHAVNLS